MNVDPTTVEVSIKDNLEQFLIVLSVSLSVATVSRIFSWFRQIPYTLLLVIAGFGFSFRRYSIGTSFARINFRDFFTATII